MDPIEHFNITATDTVDIWLGSGLICQPQFLAALEHTLFDRPMITVFVKIQWFLCFLKGLFPPFFFPQKGSKGAAGRNLLIPYALVFALVFAFPASAQTKALSGSNTHKDTHRRVPLF